MPPDPLLMPPPASIKAEGAGQWTLAGAWTISGLGTMEAALATTAPPAPLASLQALDATALTALDTAGAWLLARHMAAWRQGGAEVRISGLAEPAQRLLDQVRAAQAAGPAVPMRPEAWPARAVASLGRTVLAQAAQAQALLGFVGEVALALAGCVAHPSRWRGRPVLFNLRSAGVDALLIIGLLSFLLGIVVAYQGAEQLRRYGANVFVADLVGLSMLREFAPLITAIIIAGRSGSAYAAQIGTMGVTEEIDALRTLGIEPLELLVLPKLLAMLVALPLLTVFSDVLGVVGGMVMAQAQLGVSYADFAHRFALAVSPTTLLLGVGKAPVFAVIIVTVGCFQGFQTRGGADAVGRHTTLSVVQSIFLVIVADALFSVAFSALDL